MGVPCDRCTRSVGPEAFDEATNLAQCPHCALVFELMFRPPASLEPDAIARPVGRKRPPVPLPFRFEVELEDPEPIILPLGAMARGAMIPYREAAIERKEPDRPTVLRPNARATIRIRPPPPKSWLGLAILFPVVGGLPFFFAAVILTLRGPVGLGHILGAAPLVFVGVFLVWLLLVTLFNRRTITLAEGVLRIRHHPFPTVGGNRILPVIGIQQIWTQAVTHVWTEGRGNSRKEMTDYKVEAGLWDGSTVPLLKGLPTPAEALYIEQSLEHALGIIDVAVPQEQIVEKDGFD